MLILSVYPALPVESAFFFIYSHCSHYLIPYSHVCRNNVLLISFRWQIEAAVDREMASSSSRRKPAHEIAKPVVSKISSNDIRNINRYRRKGVL